MKRANFLSAVIATISLAGVPAIAEAAPAAAAIAGAIFTAGTTAYVVAAAVIEVFLYSAASMLINAAFQKKPKGRAPGACCAIEILYYE